MKLFILAAVVAVAYSAACDVATVSLTLGDTVIKKTSNTPAVATCSAGTFKAAVVGVLETKANLDAAVKTAAPANGDTAASKIAGWLKCKAGTSGTIKFKCDNTAKTITFEGCAAPTAAKKCATGVPAVTDVNAVFGAGTDVGTTVMTKCLGSKKTGSVWSKCNAENTWVPATGNVAGCVAAAYSGTCKIPACGAAAGTATPSCNANSGTETDCGDAAAKTAASYACAAVGACTEAKCNKNTLFAANWAPQTAASCIATAEVDQGTVVNGCTCTKRCKATKILTGATAQGSCKTIAETEVVWVCPKPTAGGGAGGSSASTLSVFAAFATLLAYLA